MAGAKDEMVEARHSATRPMKCVRDSSGDLWLCDSSADTSGDLGQQGCWKAAEMPFDRNF